jgi:hypothetical protein
MALPNISLKRTRREASLVYAGIPAARRLASPLGPNDDHRGSASSSEVWLEEHTRYPCTGGLSLALSSYAGPSP